MTLAPPQLPEGDTTGLSMRQVFDRQRAAFRLDGIPSEITRRDRLDRAIATLVDNRKAWCEALAQDFGGRATEESLLIDVLIPLENLRHAKKRLRQMMKPQRRATNFPFNLLGARGEIRFQPKGVVGNIVPWNIPILGLFGPLAAMLAAGNRVMVKMSELAPASAALAGQLMAKAFDDTEVAVFCGEAPVSAAFTALPFDHLMFTGSTRVGRMVMRTAADNLTPVTLELGGKSPAVVCEDADLELAARRIAWGKLVNGGQACIAPDYALVPKARLHAFIEAVQHAMAHQYPQPLSASGLTSIVNEAHLARLQGYIDDAIDHGTSVVEVGQSGTPTGRRMRPTLLIDPSEPCRVMQEEIFGPILPIKTYGSLDEAITYINARAHPLALYCFGGRVTTERVVNGTCSGGVAVNDVITHGMQENLPFGGIGESGMGAFHAEYGFRTFSHARTVYRGVRSDPLALLRPPFGPGTRRALDLLLRLKGA